MATISLAYLHHAKSKGDVKLVRWLYRKLLYSSNYCESPSKAPGDVAAMRTFFDECIIIEKEEMKKRRSDSRWKKQQELVLAALYDTASKCFLGINEKLAYCYSQERNEIS